MSDPEQGKDLSDQLRRRAEDALRGRFVDLDDLPMEDIQYLLHELQVHQIELTLQNDELRRIQLELETARDEYWNLYNFAPVGYCTLDRKGRILEANQTLAGLVGATQEKLVQKKLSDFVYRETQDEYFLHHQRTFETDQPQVTEIQMVKQTGERIDMRLESAVDHRDPTKIQVILSDITGRKQAEKELQLYAQDLERANQALRDFSTIISHDLQEPLRKVKAFGRLLETQLGEKLGVEGKEYLDRMISAAARMESMLQGLRAYSKVTSQEMSVERVDLGKVAAEVLTDLDARIMETGGKVVMEELPIIRADPVQMRQLFQNILSNALKYHRPEVPPLVIVNSRAIENDRMVILVKDNGIGIDLENADHIFKPYTRLGDKSAHDGTGMGLAICKKIVERHGGDISVSSVLEQGSTFTITLPI